MKTAIRFLFNLLMFGSTMFATEFSTNGTDNFAGGITEILVNGQSKGKFNISNRTLGQMIRDYARNYGLRTFSVYVDGTSRQLDTNDQVVKAICVAQKIDLVAKDSRGTDWTFIDVEPAGEAEEAPVGTQPAQS